MAAAILWGIDYTLTEKVLEKISFTTLLSIELFFGSIVMFIFAMLSGSYKMDLSALSSSKQTIAFMALIILVFTVANALIVLSIGVKNATLSGLIEISYPLFIALFSWLFFREGNVNVGTAFGGACILIGISLIYIFNR